MLNGAVALPQINSYLLLAKVYHTNWPHFTDSTFDVV